MKKIKAAVIQLKAGKNRALNVHKAMDLTQKAIRRRADLIVLPEVFAFRGEVRSSRDVEASAERVPGPSVRPLMVLARQNKVSIIAGTVWEKSNEKDKMYNTSVLIGPAGEIVCQYRKKHLFQADVGRARVRETRWFKPGRKTALGSVKGFSVGLTVCYDVRFPSLFNDYRDQGAEAVAVPSSFTHETGKAHWEVLLRARAIENLCYILAPNQIGSDAQKVRSYGNSMIIDPWGKVLARASSNREEIITAVLDKDVIRTSRRKLPGIVPVKKS